LDKIIEMFVVKSVSAELLLRLELDIKRTTFNVLIIKW